MTCSRARKRCCCIGVRYSPVASTSKALVPVEGFDHDDEYAILDRLDALVRKSLLVADRSAGRTRFSMLEIDQIDRARAELDAG